MQPRPAAPAATTTTTTTAASPRSRGRLAARLYGWLDAHRWYWSLGDPAVPTLRDWPVARPPSRR